MPAAFDDLMDKIRSREEVGIRMRNALLAASREIEDGNKVVRCKACTTLGGRRFAYCTQTPEVYDSACPECICLGIPCDRSGSVEGKFNCSLFF